MKKFTIFVTLALLLPVLAACQKAPQNDTANTPGTVSPEIAPAASATALTPDEAVSIALKDAGFTKDQVRDLDVELDHDNGADYYDVDFENGKYEYDYDIDAATGKILKSTKERD